MKDEDLFGSYPFLFCSPKGHAVSSLLIGVTEGARTPWRCTLNEESTALFNII
jgi:hypothetical protein